MTGAATPVARKWWLDPTQEDLAQVQFALRMTAQHPWLSEDEKTKCLALADSLWEGYFCQPQFDGPGPHYEDGDG